MTDQNKELDLATSKATPLISSEVLSSWLERVLTDGKEDGIAFQFIVTNNDAHLFARDNILGKQFYTLEEIATIVKRFEEMVSLIEIMVNQGFTILRLELATKEGLSGSRIKFKTPNNHQYEHQYFRDANRTIDSDLGTAMIPDDFLYDLKMFPSRHG